MACTTLLPADFEPRICGERRWDAASERSSRRAFVVISVSILAVSSAWTIVQCASMSAMRGMPMPGGWTMSMTWMRMPGQTWTEATASFIAMWVVMMAAMMLPSLIPTLWRYCQAVGSRSEPRPGRLTLIAGIGYFFVWTCLGLVVFPLGVLLAKLEMEQPLLARASPVASGMVIIFAGAVQFTPWKTHHLARCRTIPGDGSPVTGQAKTAWRHGVRLGRHCCLSCANLTAILLVIGVMDLRAMALVTAAITAERLAPASERATQGTGTFFTLAGLLLTARAAGLG